MKDGGKEGRRERGGKEELLPLFQVFPFSQVVVVVAPHIVARMLASPHARTWMAVLEGKLIDDTTAVIHTEKVRGRDASLGSLVPNAAYEQALKETRCLASKEDLWSVFEVIGETCP